MVAIITSINRLSGQRTTAMGPPPPLGPKEVTTTQSQIKRNTQRQKHQDKVAKAFVGDELDDQGWDYRH
jgi:hypothetical protein